MMQRSIVLMLIMSVLLAACASTPSSTDPSYAAATLPPIATVPSAYIHAPLEEACGGIGVDTEVHYLIRFTDYPGPDITVLDQTLGQSSETQRFALEPGPTLDQVIAFLTDGHDGRVMTRVETPSGGCSGLKSEDAFFPFKTGINDEPVDFAGYLVDAFEVRLDEIMVESPGSDPNGDGNWTEVTIRGALSVYGAFPYWPTIMRAETPVARGDTPRATPSSTPSTPSTELTDQPASASSTPGLPFPGADQWVLRLPNMRPIHLTGTRDGGYLLLAWTNWPASFDKTLLHIDAKGRILWQNDLGRVDIYGVVPAADGGAVGLIYDGLVKFSSDGEFEWQGVMRDRDGVGLQPAFSTPQAVQPGSGGQTVVFDSSISVLAADGSFVERTTLDSATIPDGYRVRRTTRDTGWYAGMIDYDGYWVQRSGLSNSWVRRFDFSHLGSDVHSEGEQILPTSDGGALFVGLAPYLRGDLARSISIWAARLDRNGNLLWHTAIDGGEDREPVVAQTTDGGFLIATSSGYMVDERGPLRLLRLNTSGNVVWDRFYRPLEGHLFPNTIVEGGDGSIAVTAHAVQGWREDSPGDLVLIKTDRHGRVLDCPWLEPPPFDPPIIRSPQTRLQAASNIRSSLSDLTFKLMDDPSIESKPASYAFEPICAFPPPPAPPTPTPHPTPSPVAAEPGQLYFFGTSNAYLLGASRDGGWLQPDDAAGHIRAPLTFGLYGLGGYRGDRTGRLRQDGVITSCLGRPWIDFTSPPPGADLIALSGRWDAQPRRVWEIVLSDTYITVVEDFLRQAGMPTTPVEIESIYRLDIEGDGFEEVLIAASHFEGGPNTFGAASGDYSILILRALVHSKVTSIPLIDQHYSSTMPEINPARLRIGGILDLNGDGAFDLVAIGEEASGTHYWTFDLTQPEVGPVLQTNCRP